MRGRGCPSTILPFHPFLTFLSFSNELCTGEPRAASQYLQAPLIPPEKSRGSQNRDLTRHTDRACCLYSSVELPLHMASRLHSSTLKQAHHLRESWPRSCGSVAGVRGEWVSIMTECPHTASQLLDRTYTSYFLYFQNAKHSMKIFV